MTRPTFAQVRTAVLFFGGLFGVGYMLVLDQTERPMLLILFGGMMGLPVFLKADDKLRLPPAHVDPPVVPPLPPAPGVTP